VDRVREHILSQEVRDWLRMTDFILIGVKLLAAAEVV
jgi:hypothetical protein